MRFSVAIALLTGLIGATALTGCAVGPPATVELKKDDAGLKRLDDMVGNVECIIDLTKNVKNFTCTNLNDAHVKLEVTRTDRAAVVLDESYLAEGRPVVGTINVVDGARYRIEVRIWETGVDLASCAFIEDMSCFQAEDSNEFSFTILP